MINYTIIDKPEDITFGTKSGRWLSILDSMSQKQVLRFSFPDKKTAMKQGALLQGCVRQGRRLYRLRYSIRIEEESYILYVCKAERCKAEQS